MTKLIPTVVVVVAACLVSAAPAAAGGLPTVTYTPGTQQAHSLYGYPWPNAPECTNGGACLNDTWGFSQGQCVSWVAYRIRQLNGPFANYPGPGWFSANNWGPHAQALGMAVDGTPALGSVAWYSYGHVAYVEAIASPTSVEISEMNFDNANGFRIRWISPGPQWPTKFIHIHDRLTAGDPTAGYHPSAAVWPVGTRNPAGQQDVFWHGWGNNGIWGAAWNNGWHGPSPVPGVSTAASSPTVVVNGPRNEEDIFYKGTGSDASLWVVNWAGRWYAPHPVGMGPLGSEPSAAVWPAGTRYPGQQDVFWHGSGNNGIWEAVWNNGWHGPSPVPGINNAASPPTAVVNGPRNEEDIFYKAVGSDESLWEVTWAGRWLAPHRVGMGPLGSEPSVAAWPAGTRYAGQQDVFWHGRGNNGIWEAVWNNGWHGPSPVPGVNNAASSPTAVVNGPRNEEDIFYKAVGSDASLWEVTWAGRWLAPHRVGMGPLG